MRPPLSIRACGQKRPQLKVSLLDMVFSRLVCRPSGVSASGLGKAPETLHIQKLAITAGMVIHEVAHVVEHRARVPGKGIHDHLGVLVALLQDAITEAPGELPVELSPRVRIGQHSGALHALLANSHGVRGKILKNGQRLNSLQTAENKKI